MRHSEDPRRHSVLGDRMSAVHQRPSQLLYDSYHSGLQTPMDRPSLVRFSIDQFHQSQQSQHNHENHHRQTLSSSHLERQVYSITTDPAQDDKGTEIKLLTFDRPHMRAFHYSWISFFVAFLGWFSIPPLMPTIKKHLQLTPDQVANSNIAAVASTIFARILAGPLCDRYGPRVVQTALLILGAIPVACVGLAQSYWSFMCIRFFIGIVGCSFVATTFWTSIMFSKEVVGSANALASGWGNLGAGVAYLIIPLLFDFLTMNPAISDDLGWRVTLICPAIFMVAAGIGLYFFSDDCPHGNYADLEQASSSISNRAEAASTNICTALLVAACQSATWILALQYACSFGVEVQVHNVLSMHYYEDFHRSSCDPATDPQKCRLLSQTRADLISALFGLMCIAARAAGGYVSDRVSLRYQMRGRIAVQFVCFAGQALCLFLYSRASDLKWSISYLITFGFFVQACTGTTFSIVPNILPQFIGAVSGIVGAGGNIGALCWGLLFKAVGDHRTSFKYLSILVAAVSLLSFVINIDEEANTRRTRTRNPVEILMPTETEQHHYEPSNSSVHGRNVTMPV